MTCNRREFFYHFLYRLISIYSRLFLYYYLPLMKNFLINLLLSALAIGVAAYIVPGVVVEWRMTALIVALILALVNATLWFLLRFLAFPVNVLTFGLVGFLISVLMILLTDNLVAGFEIANFRVAVVFAVILGIIQRALGTYTDDKSMKHI